MAIIFHLEFLKLKNFSYLAIIYSLYTKLCEKSGNQLLYGKNELFQYGICL